MNKIRIAAAISSETGITLYLEDGAEINLPSNSWRTKAILDRTLAPLARHEVVEIDLDEFSLERQIEQRTNGFIRFFRRTVRKVVSALGIGPDGQDYSTEELVAVVDGKEIPGVEAIERQIDYAIFTNNTKGLEKFMSRIAAVIDDRGHTVQELLNFMKRGDLPIANDGSIIAYKVLRSSGDHFVDCHTGKVPQRVGSRVSMKKDLVDPSRRHECSTGLHVARRGYLGRFAGDVITIIKVAPEDVIAVPFGEPDKMRVVAYHIVARLPDHVHDILRSNKPMTGDKSAAAILGDVIAGRHPGIIEDVVIGSKMGGDIKVTPRKGRAPLKGKNIGEAHSLDDDRVSVKPKDVRKAAEEAIATEKAKLKPLRKKAVKRLVKNRAVEIGKNLPEKHQQVLKMLANGASRREVERTLKICRKTIKRIVDENQS